MAADMRVGIGYDVHALVPGRPLVLGGVTVPHDRGLAGHSDADVLAHAVMDAVLGAMRSGDIGEHFPDADPAFEGVSSMDLMSRVASVVAEGGWEIADIDCVVVLERPKIAPHRDAMRGRMAEALGIPVDRVGVKATTTEGLGATGRQEGAAAYAVALLRR